MFGPLGAQELVFILILALVIFGPRQLPKIGRTVGRSLAEFRKASAELKRTFNAEMIEEEMRESDRLLRQGVDEKPRPPAREQSVRETVADAVDENGDAEREKGDAEREKGDAEREKGDAEPTGTGEDGEDGEDGATVARGTLTPDAEPAEPAETAGDDAEPATARDGDRSAGGP